MLTIQERERSKLPASYISLWNKDRCKLMRKYGHAGQPLSMLFGGPHLSQPALRKFGVKAGDFIYPIAVDKGVLFILGSMRVSRLLSIEEYVKENPAMFAAYHSTFGAEATFGRWQDAHPEIRYLAPTCTNEVAFGEGCFLERMVAIPGEELETLRFCSQRGVRGLKSIEDGSLKSTLSISGGTYRLHEASALKFEALVAGVQ